MEGREEGESRDGISAEKKQMEDSSKTVGAEDRGNRGMWCRLGSKCPPAHELTGALSVIGAYLMGCRPGGAQQPWQGAMLLTSAIFLMQIKPVTCEYASAKTTDVRQMDPQINSELCDQTWWVQCLKNHFIDPFSEICKSKASSSSAGLIVVNISDG